MFVFFAQIDREREKEKTERDGGTAQPSSAYLFSSPLAFSLLFLLLSRPYTKALMCAAMCFAIVLCLKA